MKSRHMSRFDNARCYADWRSETGNVVSSRGGVTCAVSCWDFDVSKSGSAPSDVIDLKDVAGISVFLRGSIVQPNLGPCSGSKNQRRK